MKTNPNDTAFPIINPATNEGHPGLTKREYFAALALQGLLAGTSGVEALASVHPANWSESAVECADALIANLNKVDSTTKDEA